MTGVDKAVCIGWQEWHLSDKMIVEQISEGDERMNHANI